MVLTDAVCFSSCLLLLAEYKALGALHAGQTTGVLSRYMEVRAASLPSGFGSFSTLQAVTFEMPPRLGPFDPELPYAGDISATAALEAWIPTAVQTASQSRTAIEAR
ncbi:MAG: hypothetical protein JOZ24_11490 [Candidatus Eremiobacteraeota bacterium]|nr:hypothetical protein [Candidatus Eremiobacteraeota bacterium]